MRPFTLSATLLLLALASGAQMAGAQTSGAQTLVQQTRMLAQTRASLPRPELSEDARISDLLRSAQGALAAGRKRDAGEALEMAQTRLLDRSVPLGETHDPSDNPMVAQIARARQALASGDRAACLETLQAAIASATGQGL